MYSSIVILDLTSVYSWVMPIIRLRCLEWGVSLADAEDAYDWLVTNSISNILNLTVKGKIFHHYVDDRYRCLYEELGMQLDGNIIAVLNNAGIIFKQQETIKLMVMSQSAIIARYT